MLSALLAVVATLVSALPGPLPAVGADRGLGTYEPYPAAAALVAPPPSGYEPVFTESLDRHGSRTLATHVHDGLVLAYVRQAEEAGALTDTGSDLADEVRQLQDDMEPIGIGDLTDRGRAELYGIGARVGRRLPGLFGSGSRVELWSSGMPRATDSATAFGAGLRHTAPRTTVGDVEADPRQLRFDRTDPDYVRFLDSDTAATRAIDQVAASPAVQAAARSVLRRVFEPSFVASIAAPEKVALALWNLDAVTAGMAGQTTADFSRFVHRDEARALAALDDADLFFRQGPSISGRDDTFAPARVILDDFLARIHERLDGGPVAGVFRFAHAEQLVPFSALLGLPGSTRQVAADDPLAFLDGPWHGAAVAPLGGNVQWDVLRDGRGRVLVRVLQDERQVAVASRCRPAAGTRLYYRLDELERCLR